MAIVPHRTRTPYGATKERQNLWHWKESTLCNATTQRSGGGDYAAMGWWLLIVAPLRGMGIRNLSPSLSITS